MNPNQQKTENALKHFRATAVIDWLDVEIRTLRPTQHQHIRKVLAEITGVDRWWTGAVDVQSGNTTNTFRIRVHDELANNYQRLPSPASSGAQSLKVRYSNCSYSCKV